MSAANPARDVPGLANPKPRVGVSTARAYEDVDRPRGREGRLAHGSSRMLMGTVCRVPHWATIRHRVSKRGMCAIRARCSGGAEKAMLCGMERW